MLIWGVLLGVTSADTLSETFKHPPEQAKPWCYWYWVAGDISADGITKDLENMAEVGIKLAMIGNVNVGVKTNNGEAAPVKLLSPEWRELKMHALREAKRVGVDIYFFNCPGWSQSGGPWIKPEQSMRRVIWQEFDSSGGALKQNVRAKGVPDGGSQDIAVLAVPKLNSVSIEGEQTEKQYIFSHSEPFAARSLSVHGAVKGSLFAVRNGARKLVAEIDVKAGNHKTDFLVNEPQTVSFPDAEAQRFELDCEPAEKPSGKTKRRKGSKTVPVRVTLSSEPKVAQVLNKQMGRMHPTPTPTWDSYIFKDTVEPSDASVLIQREQIIDLSDKLDANGVLNCTLPKGSWRIIYFGMVTTGKQNGPAAPEAKGLEVDKMSREHTRHHFDAYVGSLIKQMTPEEKAAFKGVTSDSYEVGSQNWTDGFAAEFEKRNGYDPIPLLATFTGTVIDSAKTSDQFLWDLRRTVADMIAEYYMGGLRDVANEHGLVIWCEPYGHWGFAGDFTIYGGYADQIGGEFWSKGKLGDIECRATSSVAHTYGKRRTYAEAFTSGLNLADNPYSFKARGEWMFCDGINHFVLHVYLHQPRDGGMPGRNAGFGTAFHRNTPWFNEAQSWVKYLQRCHTMLQWGEPAADVLVYIGDFAPQMTGPPNPVPNGYQYDYVGSDAILRNLDVVDGKWVTYDENDASRISASWQVMTIPNTLKHIRPKIQKRIDALEKKGGRIVRSVPVSAEQLGALSIKPAVSGESCSIRWIERKQADQQLFFLSNFEKAGAFTVTLRVKGKQPELMNPVTGETKSIARYQETANGTKIEIDVKDPSDSFFVLFREDATTPSVVEASAPVTELDLFYNDKNELVAETGHAGRYKLTMSDGTTRIVTMGDGSAKPEEKSAGIVITKALYGVPGVPAKQVDVTEKIQAQVSAGERRITGTNELVGRDPAFGTKKRLELVYRLDGKVHEVSIPEDEAIVLPDSKTGAGKALLALTDWETESTDNEGFTEVQSTEFSLPKRIGKDERVYLDLGRVEVMAQVTLNGRTFDTLWMPPFTLDVTDTLKTGQNKLSVRVTSTTEGRPKLGQTVLWCVSQTVVGAAQQRAATSPNVVFILADDLGITDVAAFASHFTGKKTDELFYETPHLDMLVSKGIAFSQAYANPLCSPTRASIMTGKNAARSGFTTATPRTPTYFSEKLPVPDGHSPHDAIDHKDRIKEQQAWLNGKSNTGLEPSPSNLPNVLDGHHSVFIGKWHLGGHNVEALQPAAHGFDEVPYSNDAGGARYFTKGSQEYLTDKLTDHAVDFIDNYGAERSKGVAQKPFFLYLCHFAVHTPLQAPEATIQHFADKPQKGTLGHKNAVYAAMIKHLDDSVGRIMATLKAKGLEENTLIVFASDNGGAEYTGSTENAPFKGGKATMYEGGVRVPLVYYLPGTYEGGIWCDNVVSAYDHLPTLAAITGNEVPGDLDGMDLTGILADPKAKAADRTIIWHYPYNVKVMHPDYNLPLTPRTAMRKGDYKLIWDWHGKLELYNIVEDPYEKRDLAKQQPELTEAMFKETHSWLKKNVRPHYMPQRNPDYDATQDTRPYPFRDLR